MNPDAQPFAVGDRVRTDYHPRECDLVRTVTNVRRYTTASQTGWQVTVTGPRGGAALSVDAGWFSLASEG